MPIRSQVEKISPETATKILEDAKEIQNRNVSENHVQWLSAQMTGGKWGLNGEAIIMDEEGQLLDGQHRLWAVIESGVTIESLVTRGVERKLFPTIDTGAARTSGNVLTMSGEKNSMVLSAALGWLYRYELGRMLWSLKPSGFTPLVALSLLKKHPGMRDAVEWSQSKRGDRIIRKVSSSGIAFLRYIFISQKPLKAAEFFDLVSDVTPDQQGSPTRILRDWILTKDSGRVLSGTLEELAIAIKAWNAFLSGSTPSKFIWRRAGQHPESFPAIYGETESRGKAMKVVKKVHNKRG